MRKQYLIRMLSGLFFATIMWLTGVGTVQGQFTQNRDKIKIDPSGFPPEIQKGYGLFRTKCNECHGLDTSLRPSMPPAQWTLEVKRMQAMASSRFNDGQAKVILDFLNYDESHRKAQTKSAAATSVPTSDPMAAGRQLYFAQGCDACHIIAGEGNAAGPALDGVANRLTREQLLKRMQDRRAGTVMPPLPSDTTDKQIKDLVDFLMTLKS